MIADLTEADLPAAAIYNHYVATSTATFHTASESDDDFRSQVFFDHPVHGSLALHDGDELLGYGIVAPFKSRCGYRGTAELTVYLATGTTGRGLGGQLLIALEERARSVGLRTVIGTRSAPRTPPAFACSSGRATKRPATTKLSAKNSAAFSTS